MNTYTFKLQKGSVTRETPGIRAVNRQAAEQQIEPDLEEGWSILKVYENGTSLEP